ncbi:MAG: RNA polymerase sigma factor [Planctomycetota bacterium]
MPPGGEGRELLAARLCQADTEGLRLVLARVLRDDDRARDLVQDALAAALAASASYDPARPVEPWLYQIAFNRLRNLRRRADVERRGLERKVHDAPYTPDPARLAEQREDESRLGLAVEDLPERQRLAVLLRYQEGMSCLAIAEALDTTPNAVSLLLFKARRKLREALEGAA